MRLAFLEARKLIASAVAAKQSICRASIFTSLAPKRHDDGRASLKCSPLYFCSIIGRGRAAHISDVARSSMMPKSNIASTFKYSATVISASAPSPFGLLRGPCRYFAQPARRADDSAREPQPGRPPALRAPYCRLRAPMRADSPSPRRD